MRMLTKTAVATAVTGALLLTGSAAAFAAPTTLPPTAPTAPAAAAASSTTAAAPRATVTHTTDDVPVVPIMHSYKILPSQGNWAVTPGKTRSFNITGGKINADGTGVMAFKTASNPTKTQTCTLSEANFNVGKFGTAVHCFNEDYSGYLHTQSPNSYWSWIYANDPNDGNSYVMSITFNLQPV